MLIKDSKNGMKKRILRFISFAQFVFMVSSLRFRLRSLALLLLIIKSNNQLPLLILPLISLLSTSSLPFFTSKFHLDNYNSSLIILFRSRCTSLLRPNSKSATTPPPSPASQTNQTPSPPGIQSTPLKAAANSPSPRSSSPTSSPAPPSLPRARPTNKPITTPTQPTSSVSIPL